MSTPPNNHTASRGRKSKFDLEGHDYPPSPASSDSRLGRKYALATELVYTEHNDQYNASSVPIYQVRPKEALPPSVYTKICLTII